MGGHGRRWSHFSEAECKIKGLLKHLSKACEFALAGHGQLLLPVLVGGILPPWRGLSEQCVSRVWL